MSDFCLCGMQQTSSAMTVDCLVCGKPTSATHMGMDACRACTVFYRRNRDIGDKLLCINGNRACMDYGKNVFSCRKCRLDRFESVMRAGSGEDMPPACSVISQSPDIKPIEFDRMMQQLINTPPRTPGNSIIERIRVNLQALSAFRCAGEMKLRGVHVHPSEATGQNYQLIPCTYQFMEDATKILIPGLFEFAQLTFPDFALLSHADKWMVIRNYEKIFHCVDSERRTRERFGKGSFHLFGTYTSFMSLDIGEHFFSDCPDQSNLVTAANTVRSWLEENVPKLKRQMAMVDPTNDEFLAMIGLALWSVENIDASDEMIEIASRNRTEIMADLTAQYRCAIGTEAGASRIGTLMCLLQEFRRGVMTINSDYHIYLMLGAFDENTLMSKLPIIS